MMNQLGFRIDFKIDIENLLSLNSEQREAFMVGIGKVLDGHQELTTLSKASSHQNIEENGAAYDHGKAVQPA